MFDDFDTQITPEETQEYQNYFGTKMNDTGEMRMRQISITITGVGLTPEWETLQRVIAQATYTEGKFTKIRKQAGCDYRGPGTYDIEYTPTQGDLIKVKLQVQEH